MMAASDVNGLTAKLSAGRVINELTSSLLNWLAHNGWHQFRDTLHHD